MFLCFRSCRLRDIKTVFWAPSLCDIRNAAFPWHFISQLGGNLMSKYWMCRWKAVFRFVLSSCFPVSTIHAFNIWKHSMFILSIYIVLTIDVGRLHRSLPSRRLQSEVPNSHNVMVRSPARRPVAKAAPTVVFVCCWARDTPVTASGGLASANASLCVAVL